jgi:hypothetical protein
LQVYAGATVLYFLSIDLLQNCPAVMAARTIALCIAARLRFGSVQMRAPSCLEIALNPYK